MSATATKEKAQPAAAAADLADALGADAMSLADLKKLGVDDMAIARAWAAGNIEFGHRQYCVTGPAGKIGSALVLEDGWDWSGPKTKMHKGYKELAGDQLPKVEKFKKYVAQPPEKFGDEPVLKPVEVSEAEALAAVALHVRLTDQGLAASA